MKFRKYNIPKPDPKNQKEKDLYNSLNEMILDLDSIFNQAADYDDYDLRYLKLDASNSMSGATLITNLNADMVDGIHASTFFTEAQGDIRYLQILATAANSDKWDNAQFADYLDQAVKTTSSPRFAKLEIDDANTYVDKDGSGNMTFTDAVVGTRTLKQLGCPTMVKLIANGQSAGSLNLTYASWGVSKAQIMNIKVTSATCTDFDVEIFEKDTFAAAYSVYNSEDNDLNLKDMIGVLIYEDQDGTDELHIKITNNGGGAPTFDVEIRGIELI